MAYEEFPTPEQEQAAKEQMSEEQSNASWRRGNEYINTTPEQREMLEDSNLKMEIVDSELVLDKGETHIIKITGEVEGKKVEVNRRVAPMPDNGVSYSDYDSKGVRIPEDYPIRALSTNDEYWGEVDGESISGDEAKELWLKYQRVANVNKTDERLVDYIKKSEQN